MKAFQVCGMYVIAESERDAWALHDELAKLARGVYQRSLMNGTQRWSGSDLRGKASSSGAHYERSRRSLLIRIGGSYVWTKMEDDIMHPRVQRRTGVRRRSTVIVGGTDESREIIKTMLTENLPVDRDDTEHAYRLLIGATECGLGRSAAVAVIRARMAAETDLRTSRKQIELHSVDAVAEVSEGTDDGDLRAVSLG